MSQRELDEKLQKLYVDGLDEEFVNFCESIIPHYPVAINLADKANEYFDSLENALVVFSGYEFEKAGEISMKAVVMKMQEIENGRWAGMPTDEIATAELIAHRCYDDLRTNNTEDDNTWSVMLVIGLYVYATVLCNDAFDAMSYCKLFVLAWFVYWGNVLSVEHRDTGNQSVS